MAGPPYLVTPAYPYVRRDLTSSLMIVGRSSRCGLVINHSTVSREHARLTTFGSMVTVKDLESRNGTFIDGRKISEPEPLMPGQEIRFGQMAWVLCDPKSDSDDKSDEETEYPSDQSSNALHYPSDPRVQELTAAQQRVLGLVLEGLSEKKIAGLLGNSQHTIHTHLRAIYRIFGVHSRSELAAILWPKGEED